MLCAMELVADNGMTIHYGGTFHGRRFFISKNNVGVAQVDLLEDEAGVRRAMAVAEKAWKWWVEQEETGSG